MEEGGFDKQRRNVFVLSTTIIAFNVAGGDLTELTFQGMKLKNAYAAMAMVWLAFAYVVWRYWLYAREPYRALSEAFWEYVKPDSGLQEQVELLLEQDFSKIDFFADEEEPWEYFPSQGLFTPPACSAQGFVEDDQGTPILSRTDPRRLRHDFAIALLIEYGPRYAQRHPGFSDVLLPYLLAIIGVGTALCRWFLF